MAKFETPFNFGNEDQRSEPLERVTAQAQATDWASPTVVTQADPSLAVRDRFVRCHLNEAGALVIDHIPNGFTEDEKELIAYWYPTQYMQVSPYVESSTGLVLTAEHALLHAYGVLQEQKKAKEKATASEARELRAKEKELKVEERQQRLEARQQREESKALQEEFARLHMEWIALCGQRKVAIDAATTEWRNRVRQRKESLVQWDKYVSEAREALDAARAIPVPIRPVKP